jgi:hypothetical protein
MNKRTAKKYNQIKSFLEADNFNGFTKKDLFIMQFIKKGWGQDIVALSNMAEALTNIAVNKLKPILEVKELLNKGYSVRAVDIKPFEKWYQFFDEVENNQLDVAIKENCFKMAKDFKDSKMGKFLDSCDPVAKEMSIGMDKTSSQKR